MTALGRLPGHAPFRWRRPAAARSAFLLMILVACAKKPDVQAEHRAACDFGPGDMPSATLADFAPIGSAMPIDHIILVMQENRSFDSYYSSLAVPGQTVDGASPTATNPDPTNPGGTISRFHQTAYCVDNPAETWDQVHLEIDDGKMDGFTTQNAASDFMTDPAGRRAMGYFDSTDIPFYYGLAQAFAISDRHFASVPGPTYPNRLYYFAGTSWGTIDDSLPPSADVHGNPYPNLFTRLNDAKVSWSVYYQDVPTPGLLTDTWLNNVSHFYPQSQFFTDAAAGQLPSVTLVEGTDLRGGVSPDEDPPADMQVGEAMIAQIVQAVMTSPQWPKSALFLSYDEGGGFYDHVPPPSACVPDDIPPNPAKTIVGGAFNSYGERIPLLAVSPYAKRGYVSHQPTDHTSVLRFVAARFGLPALTKRDANAEPPFDLFDFSHADTRVPDLPAASIDATQQTTCAAMYPPSSL